MPTRTYPVIDDHVEAVRAYLDSQLNDWPVVHWWRPIVDATEKYISPPYVMTRVFPSAAEMEGPLNDSQADVIVRIQIMAVGEIERQPQIMLDIVRPHMQRRNFTIPNRFVMDVGLMVASGGTTRDDDLPTPYFYAHDLYELRTTPA